MSAMLMQLRTMFAALLTPVIPAIRREGNGNYVVSGAFAFERAYTDYDAATLQLAEDTLVSLEYRDRNADASLEVALKQLVESLGGRVEVSDSTLNVWANRQGTSYHVASFVYDEASDTMRMGTFLTRRTRGPRRIA